MSPLESLFSLDGRRDGSKESELKLSVSLEECVVALRRVSEGPRRVSYGSPLCVLANADGRPESKQNAQP